VPPPKVKVPPARATVPLLVTVKVLAPLGVPIAWLPKANAFGVTVAVAVLPPAPAPNSTAPTSTALFVFLKVPKKSVAGAAA